jgi:hypothetical protein
VQEEVDLGKAGLVQPCRERIRKRLVAPCHQGSLHRRLKAYAGQAIIISSSWVRERPNQGHRADAVTRAAYAWPLACCSQLLRVRAI